VTDACLVMVSNGDEEITLYGFYRSLALKNVGGGGLHKK